MDKAKSKTNIIDAKDTITSGGIAVIRTDTIYGIIASARNESAVDKVFKSKGRRSDKPPIVLISSLSQMFDPIYDEVLKNKLREYWPGPYSIIMPSVNAPIWITRGSSSVAYRMPDNKGISKLINIVGPIIAPSANPEGLEVARSVQEAIEYFGDSVDCYVDGGFTKKVKPSTLIKIQSDGSTKVVR